MKKFIYVFLLLLFGSFAASAQIPTKPLVKPAAAVVEREKFDPTRNPNDDLQAAIANAAKENKRIVLDVGGEWCGWCVNMDKFFIAHKDLKNLRDAGFVWVKINMSDENENKEFLTKYPEIKGYPHLFVLEKDGSLLKSKDTSELEEGKTYSLQKFTDFLKEYAPAKTDAAK